MSLGELHRGDALEVLPTLPAAFARLVYIDPPFNTGRTQRHTRLRTIQDEDGNRTGFAGRRYRSEAISSASYTDQFEDFEAFLVPSPNSGTRGDVTVDVVG